MPARLPQAAIWPLIFVLAALVALTGPVATAAARRTQLVSLDSSGAQAHGTSFPRSVSADGRYIAFFSDAPDLVAGDTNGTYDVFVRDRRTGVTQRVSISSAGTQGNALSGDPALSADGRYVAFTSAASNLVAGDTNGVADVFVRDLQSGVTTRVSLSSTGAQGNAVSSGEALSADGRFVTFTSAASNLVAGDTNGAEDVFVRDRQTGVTTRASVSSAGGEGNDRSLLAVLSADGRYVAFVSEASNLVAGDTNAGDDVFVRDRETGVTQRVSVSSAGAQGLNDTSDAPTISPDGRYVAFESFATNLVAGDTNGVEDIFVHDRQTHATSRVSVAGSGAQGNGDSFEATISADGRYVAFASVATTLVPGDANGYSDVFLRDRQTAATVRVSVDDAGAAANGDSVLPSITPDGRFVAYFSAASNLVPEDVNGWGDAFLLDRATPASYGELVAADLPSGYWRLGERAGTTLADSSGSHADGSYLGGVTLGVPGALAGDADTAASFDGVDDVGRIPDAAALDVGAAFTAEAWIKRSSTAAGEELINKGANGLQLVVMSAANGNQVWLRRANVTTIAHSVGGVPADGRYHHVVATMNGPGTARLYIDGNLDSVTVSAVQAIADTTQPLSIGSGSGAPASLDEVALYDRALSGAEIAAHHAAGVAGVH